MRSVKYNCPGVHVFPYVYVAKDVRGAALIGLS